LKEKIMKPIEESSPLTVRIEGEDLVIRIGIPLLAHALQGAPNWDQSFLITDWESFTKDMIRELEDEEEDGTTPVHRMLDAAALGAIEGGSEHVEEIDPSDCDLE
jgi:hypothetical protein